jgi:hypothetical protein
MYLYLNLFRIAFYAVLGVAVFTNDVPWFVPVGWFLYDMIWPVYVKVPFTKPPPMPGMVKNGVQYMAPDQVDLSDLLRVRGGLNKGNNRSH